MNNIKLTEKVKGETQKLIINGKEYPLWQQFIDKKEDFIGGILEDSGDSMDRAMFGGETFKTKITDVTLEPNGDKSAFFSFVGEDFTCGFDVSVGGIGAGDGKCLTFYGYGGHKFTVTTFPQASQIAEKEEK